MNKNEVYKLNDSVKRFLPLKTCLEEHSFEDSKFVHKERGFFLLILYFLNDNILTKKSLMFDSLRF